MHTKVRYLHSVCHQLPRLGRILNPWRLGRTLSLRPLVRRSARRQIGGSAIGPARHIGSQRPCRDTTSTCSLRNVLYVACAWSRGLWVARVGHVGASRVCENLSPISVFSHVSCKQGT